MLKKLPKNHIWEIFCNDSISSIPKIKKQEYNTLFEAQNQAVVLDDDKYKKEVIID